MKLWEMMKLAEENPSQKYNYKFKQGGLKIAKIGREINLVYDNGHGVVMNADGYEKVKQSVTWQEALEAWAVEGKTIRCKDDECDWLFLGHRSVLKDTAGPIDRFQINGGTWYIEN